MSEYIGLSNEVISESEENRIASYSISLIKTPPPSTLLIPVVSILILMSIGLYYSTKVLIKDYSIHEGIIKTKSSSDSSIWYANIKVSERDHLKIKSGLLAYVRVSNSNELSEIKGEIENFLRTEDGIEYTVKLYPEATESKWLNEHRLQAEDSPVKATIITGTEVAFNKFKKMFLNK